MTAARLTILHILAPGAVGGLERVVESLARGHAALGHRVHAALVGVTGDQHPVAVSLAAAGATVHRIAVGGRAYLGERRTVARLIAAVAPHVMHTHGYRPDVVDSPVARRAGLPVITTVHGFTGGDWKNRLYETMQVRAFRRFDAVVAVSDPLAALLRSRGVPPDILRVLRNAWVPGAPPLSRAEARRVLGIPLEGWRIGWVGRLTPEKGADVLLEAIARLARPDVAVSIVGQGREAAALAARAAAAGLADRVTWHGMISDAGRCLAAFDLFVLSSHTEGTPIVLLEAMAAGTPIVATRVGGVPDVVSDEEALLVSPADPSELAVALAVALDDRPAAEARAEAARRRLATQFGAGPWLEAYLDLYRRLAVRAGGRSVS